MISGVRHTGIVVNDIENAIEFWTKLFNFEVVTDKVEEGEFIDNLLGLSDVSVRTVKLAAQDGSIIELLRFTNHISLPVWDGYPYTTGLTHVALNSKDLHSIVLKLEQNGYSKINKIQKSPDGKVLVCYVKGFEGTLLELVETI
jgi:catechol 2,3-dioxygenase-like lactoylglutathione lyase family enzyme